LFDEQDCDSFRLKCLEHRLHLLHDARREPEKRLVDHEQPWKRHETAAGGAIAFALNGFVPVLMMIALAAIIGATLSRRIPETA
jgi:hypothetical protein